MEKFENICWNLHFQGVKTPDGVGLYSLILLKIVCTITCIKKVRQKPYSPIYMLSFDTIYVNWCEESDCVICVFCSRNRLVL